jgi:hypothetical protein
MSRTAHLLAFSLPSNSVTTNDDALRAGKLPKPTAPTTYGEWKAAAVALMGGPGPMREREWSRLYIPGTEPGEAGKVADTHKHNTVAADRKRSRR